jgi:tetratricopeptide (TPR) repeat protein
LALTREIGDHDGMAGSLACLAQAACGLKEYEEGKQLYEKSLALYRDVGNMSGIALGLGDLSELATVLGQYADATQLARESLAINEKLGHPAEEAWALRVLGNVARERGDLEGARNYFRQALEAGTSVRATLQVLITLVGIAALRMREGRKDEACELLGLVLSHPSTRQWTKDRAAPLVAQLEAELPPDVFAATQECGKGHDLDQVVAELLADQVR